jgi:hypothetical protein
MEFLHFTYSSDIKGRDEGRFDELSLAEALRLKNDDRFAAVKCFGFTATLVGDPPAIANAVPIARAARCVMYMYGTEAVIMHRKDTGWTCLYIRVADASGIFEEALRAYARLYA